jgi:hypothetical protein
MVVCTSFNSSQTESKKSIDTFSLYLDLCFNACITSHLPSTSLFSITIYYTRYCLRSIIVRRYALTNWVAFPILTPKSTDISRRTFSDLCRIVRIAFCANADDKVGMVTAGHPVEVHTGVSGIRGIKLAWVLAGGGLSGYQSGCGNDNDGEESRNGSRWCLGQDESHVAGGDWICFRVEI